MCNETEVIREAEERISKLEKTLQKIMDSPGNTTTIQLKLIAEYGLNDQASS